MGYTRYVTRRRARFKALSGEVNIPYGTVLENRGGTLMLNGKRICRASSQNACDYFSRDDDGQGVERGKLVTAILAQLKPDLRNDDAGHQARWDKVWADRLCQRYRRLEHEDYWLWNQAFYEAPVEDLRHIALLIGAKA